MLNFFSFLIFKSNFFLKFSILDFFFRISNSQFLIFFGQNCEMNWSVGWRGRDFGLSSESGIVAGRQLRSVSPPPGRGRRLVDIRGAPSTLTDRTPWKKETKSAESIASCAAPIKTPLNRNSGPIQFRPSVLPHPTPPPLTPSSESIKHDTKTSSCLPCIHRHIKVTWTTIESRSLSTR